MKFNHAIIACSTFALLGACTTTPYVPTLYDASVSQVNTIAIVNDSLPEKMKANDVSTAMGTGGASGGLIGVLTIAAIEGTASASRESTLKKLLEPTGFDPETEFEALLVKKLKVAGFAGLAVIGDDKRTQRDLEEYPSTTADAILDVNAFFFGVQKGGSGQEWHPAAGLIVKMVSGMDKSVLLENRISYNSGGTEGTSVEGIITMFPKPINNGFTSVKKITADEIIAEYRTMFDDLTTQIVSLLSNNDKA